MMVKSNLKSQTLKKREGIFLRISYHESTSLLGNNYYSVAYNMINVKMFDKFMILDCF